MKKVLIDFKRTEYDPVIDYIKGLCILFVIWTHCMTREELSLILFPFWGDTAVPIFLIIQAFHCYKKNSDARIPDIKKLWFRILKPYLILLGCTFILDYFIYFQDTNGTFDLHLYWQLRGPESYYIFIYIQFAFILPLLRPIFNKISQKWYFLLFLLASQISEFVFSIANCPDNIYRLTFFRYIFLIYLGYLIAQEGIEINKKIIPVIILSVIFIYIFCYTSYDLRPIFCTNHNFWPLCHWVCYFYIVYCVIGFMKNSYGRMADNNLRIVNLIKKIGKYSYEIYLFQIFYFSTISIHIGNYVSSVGNYFIERTIYVIISTTLCTLPVLYILKKRYL